MSWIHWSDKNGSKQIELISKLDVQLISKLDVRASKFQQRRRRKFRAHTNMSNALRHNMLRTMRRMPASRTVRAQAAQPSPRPRQPAAQLLRLYSTTPTQHQVEVQFGRPFQDFAILLSRFARALLLGGLGLGGVTLLVFEGGHQYVEYGLMRRGGSKKLAESDDAWGWNSELALDSTSIASLGCAEGGGTDSRLGIRARHAVRSAWMCANFGAGLAPGLFFSPAEQAAASVHQASAARHAAEMIGGGGTVDNGMLYAERYLQSAIGAAEEKGISLPDIAAIRLGLAPPTSYTSVDPTALSLELALAAVRERQGTPRALEAAAAGYERIYDALEAQTVSPNDAPARLALLATRIGTAYTDLGRQDKARLWLDRAVDCVGGQTEDVRVQAAEAGVTSLSGSDHSSGKSSSWWPFGGSSVAKPAAEAPAVTPASASRAMEASPAHISSASTRALLGALLARSVLLVSARTSSTKKAVSPTRSDLEEALRTQSLVMRLVSDGTSQASGASPAAELHQLHQELQYALASLYAAETVYALRSAGAREKDILAILPSRTADDVERTQRAVMEKKGKGKSSARPPSSKHATTLDLLYSAQATSSSVLRSLSDPQVSQKRASALPATLSERWAKDAGLGKLAARLLLQSQRVFDSATATEELLVRIGA